MVASAASNPKTVGVLTKPLPAALNSSSLEVPEINQSGITFFTNVACPYAARAHIALMESGIAYDHIEIDLRDKPNWYPSVNPRSKVPALIDNTPGHVLKKDEVLIESALLAQYIADQFAPKLNGKTPFEVYVGRLWVDNVSNNVSNLYKIVGNKDPSKEEELKQQALKIVKEFNDQLTSNGAKSADSTSPWILGGDTPSIYDVQTIPFVARFMDIVPYFTGWDLGQNSAVWRFINAWEQRESFQSSWAGGQYLRDGAEKMGWAVKRSSAA
jgi:glutathione S-transferase